MKKIKKFIERVNKIFSNSENILKQIDLLQTQNNNLLKECNDLKVLINILNLKAEENKNQTNSIIKKLIYINPEILNLDYSIQEKKVLLVGFYGAPNLGDELMLEIIFNKISHIKNIDITIMLSENRDFDITHYPKCKIVHYPQSILDINILADYFDTIIFGGGALIDDSDYDLYNNQLSLSNTLINLTTRMITFGKQTILYGLSSSNNISNPEYINKLDYIINNSSYFSLRDTNSLNVIKKLGINTSKIKIVHDIVLASNYLKFGRQIESNIINIAIIYICNIDYYNLYVSCTNWLIEELKKTKLKYKITFVPFYEYMNNDTNFYKKLINEINDNNLEIACYPYNFNNLCNILKNKNFIISMRYHGSLISNILGIPILNIIYDIHRHYNNKMNYLYDNYKFKKIELLFSKIDEITFKNKINELINTKKLKVATKLYNESNEQINEIINILENEVNNVKN